MAIDPALAAAVVNPYAGAAVLGGRALGVGKPINVPQHEAIDLDPGTKGLIDKQRALSGESASQISDKTMQGAQALGQQAMMNPGEADQKASALGMANPSDLSKNLAARGQRYYQGDIAKLQNQANMSAGDKMVSRQQQALQNQQHLQQVHAQAYNSALGNEMAKRKARGQMLGSILGIGGMAAGTIAGGPKGAQAGAGVGQAAGEGSEAFQG